MRGGDRQKDKYLELTVQGVLGSGGPEAAALPAWVGVGWRGERPSCRLALNLVLTGDN